VRKKIHMKESSNSKSHLKKLKTCTHIDIRVKMRKDNHIRKDNQIVMYHITHIRIMSVRLHLNIQDLPILSTRIERLKLLSLDNH
jgi:hypothetical protein